MNYHAFKTHKWHYNKDTQTLNRRNHREYLREHHPGYVKEIHDIDAKRKRRFRSNMSLETKKVQRKLDSDRKWAQRHALAEVFPEDHDDVKRRHAQLERRRRAAKPEHIRETERLNNRMRMRAERKGKTEYDYVDINKIRQGLSDMEEPPKQSPKRKYRRSPDTRKTHAAQEQRRVASLSPNARAKAREIDAKRKRERRAAKSDAQRRKDRQKNALRMKKKKEKSVLHVNQSAEPVRQNFSINWYRAERWWSNKMNYYTVINGQEYFQYNMHSLMVKDSM